MLVFYTAAVNEVILSWMGLSTEWDLYTEWVLVFW